MAEYLTTLQFFLLSESVFLIKADYFLYWTVPWIKELDYTETDTVLRGLLFINFHATLRTDMVE